MDYVRFILMVVVVFLWGLMISLLSKLDNIYLLFKKRRKVMLKGISIVEKAKEHFEKIGHPMNRFQINNAVTTVYAVMQDEELLVDLLLAHLYPDTEFKTRYND